MENFDEFYEILNNLNINAKYFKNDKNFKPSEDLLDRLNDIEFELLSMIIKDKEKQQPIT